MSTNEKKRTLVEVTIAAPVDEVWRAVREPDQLMNWFGWDADSLAEEVDFIFTKAVACDEREHTLRFAEWEGISDGFELVERDGHTVLRVVRFGGADIDWESTYEDVNEGWMTFVQQLRLLVERHRGARRRTLYLSGGAKPGVSLPSAALEVADLRRLADGDAYDATLAIPASLTGRVWHRTKFQLGLTVDEWGDGLLVVTDKDVTDKRPHGGGALLLTTFGLEDDAFDALERRWTDWWRQRYVD